jgi:hypothetical protein
MPSFRSTGRGRSVDKPVRLCTVRPTVMTRTGLSVLTVALVLAGCGNSHSGGGSAALKLRATQTSFTPIEPIAGALKPGDSFITSSDIAGGGHENAYCVIAERAHTDLCTVTVVLPRGQLSAQGVFVNAPKLSGTIAVLSGTKAYDGAVGSLTTNGLIDHSESIGISLG